MTDFLNKDELERYARHLSLAGFGLEAQHKLKCSHVLMIGAGGLGCPALLYLAAVGVGRITIIDADLVELSNLQRQVIFTTDDIGELKVDVVAKRLRGLNPQLEITPRPECFNRTNALALVRECDVVIDGSDNFTTRYLVNDACVMEGRPFVYGAIHGFEGQASVFNWQHGPTYRCLFPEPARPAFAPNCSDNGVLGVLPGLIGTVQATEAIKLITGIGESLSGRLLLWDALTMRTRTLTLNADPHSQNITELQPEHQAKICSVSLNLKTDEIDATELRLTLAKVQLIDVREAWERAIGTILPSTHLSLEKLQSNPLSPEVHLFDPKKPTVIFCESGSRSEHALAILREHHGFNQLRSLRGGYRAWNDK